MYILKFFTTSKVTRGDSYNVIPMYHIYLTILFY